MNHECEPMRETFAGQDTVKGIVVHILGRWAIQIETVEPREPSMSWLEIKACPWCAEMLPDVETVPPARARALKDLRR